MAAHPQHPLPPTPNGPAVPRRTQAEALARARRRRFLAETALSLMLPLVAWTSGLAPRLAEGLGAMATEPAWLRWVGTALLVGALLLAYRLCLLPLAYFAGYRLARRYGLATQTARGWAVDWLKVTALTLAFGVLLALLFYAAVAVGGAHWWWMYGLVLSAGVVLLTYITPYLLLPLFYRLRPLEPGPLTARIEALFARAGVAAPRVAAIDLSARTTAANAAVIGLGRSRRVVLGDTLLREFPLDEIEAVVAHELGHHVRADIWRGIAVELGALWVGLGVAAWGLDPLFAAAGWGDWRAPAAFPLLVLLAEALGLVALPLLNAFSRHVEQMADRYALTLTRNPAAFVAALCRLEAQNLLEPEPPRWAELLLYTHPPLARRLQAAEQARHA
jgi:STE24 endopeptidase